MLLPRPLLRSLLAVGALLAATLLVVPSGAAHAAAHRRGTAANAKQIVRIAKSHVGKSRYRAGGASPRRGFDCSGFTKYVYRRAGAGTLPHLADGQLRMKRMAFHRRVNARPGDLVFYLNGRRAFHVAIYAGHGKQYAAATAGTRIKYQKIWSRNVRYGRLR